MMTRVHQCSFWQKDIYSLIFAAQMFLFGLIRAAEFRHKDDDDDDDIISFSHDDDDEPFHRKVQVLP